MEVSSGRGADTTWSGWVVAGGLTGMTPSAWVVAGGFAGTESGGMAGAAGNVLVVLVLVVLDVWARAGVTDRPSTAAAANRCLCRLMAGRLAVEDLTAAPYPP